MLNTTNETSIDELRKESIKKYLGIKKELPGGVYDENAQIYYATKEKKIYIIHMPKSEGWMRFSKDECYQFERALDERVEVPFEEIEYYRHVTETKKDVNGYNLEHLIDGAEAASIFGFGLISGAREMVKEHKEAEKFSQTIDKYYLKFYDESQFEITIEVYDMLCKNCPERMYGKSLPRFRNKEEQSVPASNSNADKFSEVRKYKELLNEGIITQEEFDKKKKELLGL